MNKIEKERTAFMPYENFKKMFDFDGESYLEKRSQDKELWRLIKEFASYHQTAKEAMSGMDETMDKFHQYVSENFIWNGHLEKEGQK